MSQDERYIVVDRPPDPSDPLVVMDVDGTQVALVGVDGEIYAFDDDCSHRSCPLSEGTIEGAIVTCPCHKSRFDLRTGAALNGPATEPIRVRQVVRDGLQILVER